MADDIIDQLSQYIAGTVLKQPRRVVASQEPLISGGLIDSFSLVDLALFVEEKFSVHIDDTELTAETFDTLEQLANLIRTRQP